MKTHNTPTGFNCHAGFDGSASLYVANGFLELSGWCFVESHPEPPSVRVVVGDQIFGCQNRLARPDVAQAFPHLPQAASCGFSLKSWCPAGFHEADLQMSTNGTWSVVRSLPLCGGLAPLLAGIDEIKEGQHKCKEFTGWVSHPQFPIANLWLESEYESLECVLHTNQEAEAIPHFDTDPIYRFACKQQLPYPVSCKRLVARLESGSLVSSHWLKDATKPHVALTPGRDSEDRRRAARIRFKRSENPTVSIIIPIYNNVGLTLSCLEALKKNTIDHKCEVIVVDDGSDEHTNNCVARIRGIRLLTQENKGFLCACNSGAGVARGRYLLFLNNDTAVTSNWLAPLLRVFSQQADAGIVGPKFLYPDGRLQEAGASMCRDAFSHRYGQLGDPSEPQFNFLRETNYVSGACLLVPKAVFDGLGGFDPRFSPGYYEDVDLAFRIREIGRKAYYQPDSVVLHHEGASAQPGRLAKILVNQKAFYNRWRRTLRLRPALQTLIAASARGESRGHRALIIARSHHKTDTSRLPRRLWLCRLVVDLGFFATYVSIGKMSPSIVKFLQGIGVQCIEKSRTIDASAFLATEGESFSLVIFCSIRPRSPLNGFSSENWTVVRLSNV